VLHTLLTFIIIKKSSSSSSSAAAAAAAAVTVQNSSAVRIVLFHFELYRIEYWAIVQNFELNQIVFIILKSLH